MIYEILDLIHDELLKIGIIAEITNRIKDPSSVLKKLTREEETAKELTDLLALRIITKNTDECYKVRDVIHNLYERDIDKYKDYIAKPKSNGYQSIHTIVNIFTRNSKHKVEIQIRTLEMHNHAELGEAAHWKYKSDKKSQLQCSHSSKLWKAYEPLSQLYWTEPELINYKNVIKEYVAALISVRKQS